MFHFYAVWGISTGTVRRLERRGITDMAGIAQFPSELLYKDFGINAELLIDHAWGRESCLMSDIKNYKSKSKSVSSSQILFEDYTFEKAKIVVEEMVRSGCLELMRRKVIASNVSVSIGYSKDCHAPTGGRTKIGASTNLPQKILPSAMRVFEQTTDRSSKIRRISIAFDGICDEGCEGYDLFTDWEEVERQKRLASATLELQSKFGKNAVVMASDLQSALPTTNLNCSIPTACSTSTRSKA